MVVIRLQRGGAKKTPILSNRLETTHAMPVTVVTSKTSGFNPLAQGQKCHYASTLTLPSMDQQGAQPF